MLDEIGRLQKQDVLHTLMSLKQMAPHDKVRSRLDGPRLQEQDVLHTLARMKQRRPMTDVSSQV